MSRMEHTIVFAGIVCASAVEVYAIHNGVNGYGLIAFFTSIGGFVGYNFGRIKDLRRKANDLIQREKDQP